MADYLKRVGSQIISFLKGLSPVKKAAMGGTAILIMFALGLLFQWAGSRTYQPLGQGLNPEDSASLIRLLREKRIPFRVEEGGKVVSVPPENVLDLRLELASMGMTQSNIVGYEVFDKQSLGTTSFVQKVNQKRALEGELMRTINQIRGVRRTRVHLALPTKSAFVEDQKKPTASVVLDLEPGQPLSEKQIFGIGNLVARAVEGMEVTDVVIVDSGGKTLSRNPTDPIAAATATQLDFRQKVEQDMEKRIEEMLSRVVGEGKVVARVSADLDFSQVNETQTMYDADGTAIRSIQRDNKSAEGTRPGPAGIAGVQSNQPGAPPPTNAQVRTDTKTTAEVVNNEVPQTVRRTTRAPGSIKRISVAVVVDGKTAKSTDKDGKVLSKVEAWPPEKLKEFEDVVAGAVGIDRKRGDTLEIRNMEFTREDFEEANKLIAENERRSYIQTMLLYAVVGLIVFGFLMIVVRPFIKWLTENTTDSVDTFLPQTIEELEKLQKNATIQGLEDVVPVRPDKIDPEKVEGEMIKEKIITLVDANPHKAALILKEWLLKEAAKKPSSAAEGGDKPGKSA